MLRVPAQRWFNLSLWTLALYAMSAGCGKDAVTTSSSPSPQPAATAGAPSPTPNARNMASTSAWTTVEEFDFDWQKDTPAHFKLEQMSGERSRLTVQMRGQRDFILESDLGWVEYGSDYQPGEKFLRANKNLSSSKYALILPISAESNASRLVFLFGDEYASDTERLHVLALDASGSPKVIFDRNFHVTEFHDLDGDGVSEIAGQPCFSQGWGHDLLTYDPFHVYQVITPAEMPARLSLPLTREYNLKHYYGWAGPDCSEDLAVVLHPPKHGKPVIVKASEAEKMFEKKN